ncbi:MAG TPA: glycosyltransferase [Nocardioidaceae bacterium]|nr:glycosyltransferase [Nocardioidaceae bacterium]
MRILLICPYFPPENAIAAVRMGSFARHLAEAGDSIRVLAREPETSGLSEPDAELEIAVQRVPDPAIATKMHLRRLALMTDPRRLVDIPGNSQGNQGLVPAVRDKVERGVRSIVNFPDPFTYWAFRAIRKADLQDWMPDVIVASAGPMSSFVVAQRLSRLYKVPWVADYRDLLSTGFYFPFGRFRRSIDRRVEYSLVKGASAITAVSQPMADHLARFHGARVHLVMNGYEPTEFGVPPASESSPAAVSQLSLVYCGEVYAGRRDPSQLFKAMRTLQGHGSDVTVDFYGATVNWLQELVVREGLVGRVHLHKRVNHAESLSLQCSADVLLLLTWNDPREAYTMTGKVFEYIGARRPILMLGYKNSAAARLVRDRRLGVIANEPDDIAAALSAWAREKQSRGAISQVSEGAGVGLTRRDQALAMRAILTRITP